MIGYLFGCSETSLKSSEFHIENLMCFNVSRGDVILLSTKMLIQGWGSALGTVLFSCVTLGNCENKHFKTLMQIHLLKAGDKFGILCYRLAHLCILFISIKCV